MKKQSSNRIKRKNLNSRLRAKKANKHKGQSFVKKVMADKIVVNDSVKPTSKHIWPNQAQPKGVF